MDEFEEDDLDSITEIIIPFLRIYISAGREDHDLLDVEEVVDWLTSDNKSINETIKELIDKGMLNVYACSFNRSVKVF
jgi:hypothetical protein